MEARSCIQVSAVLSNVGCCLSKILVLSCAVITCGSDAMCITGHTLDSRRLVP